MWGCRDIACGLHLVVGEHMVEIQGLGVLSGLWVYVVLVWDLGVDVLGMYTCGMVFLFGW